VQERVAARVSAGTSIAAGSAGATALLITTQPWVSLWWQLLLFGAASSMLAALLLAPSLRTTLSSRAVLALAVALLALVAVFPPRYSTDTANYAAYGRIEAHYGKSSYEHPPREFRDDPVVGRIPHRWDKTESPYGPAFTYFSSMVSHATGTSALASRLVYQGVALLAAVFALVLLRRAGVPPAALALVGLHPVLAIAVNGGNNDVLVGSAILAGVFLATRRRFLPAAGMLALGVLVKLVAVVAVVGVLVWLWQQHGRRVALAFTAGCTALVCAGFGLAGGSKVLEGLTSATRQWSRASFWNYPRDWLADVVTFSGPVARGVSRGSAEFTANVATLAIIVVTLAVLLAFRRELDAPRAAIVGPLVFVLLAAYALPRYGLWALPAAGLVWRSRLARLLAVSMAALQLVYLRPAIDTAGPAVDLLRLLDVLVVPVLVAGAAVGVLLQARRRTRVPVPVAS
jgi:Glycosyltransferase family 87